MPKFEIVAMSEVQTKTATGQSRLVLEYVELIRSVGPGKAGLLTPDEGETTNAIRRRLGTAAKAMGVDLTIKNAGGAIYFWAAKRRRGRPRKVTLGG